MSTHTYNLIFGLINWENKILDNSYRNFFILNLLEIQDLKTLFLFIIKIQAYQLGPPN